MIKHHVKEEEQRGGMCAKAKTADLDLRELGAELKARKDELMQAAKRRNEAPPQLLLDFVTDRFRGARPRPTGFVGAAAQFGAIVVVPIP